LSVQIGANYHRKFGGRRNLGDIGMHVSKRSTGYVSARIDHRFGGDATLATR
jgi:hypothetical protein